LRGIHVYLKIGGKEPPKNSMLFYQGKRIGSFLSKGRQVVGVGSVNKKLIKRGKWFWKFENVEELKNKLGKYEVELR
jgi:hypothetical protein